MENTKKKSKAKRIWTIVLNCVVYSFFALCAVALFFSVFAKKDSNGAGEIFGKRFMTVLTSSMEKCDETDVSKYEIKDIPVNSLIFIDPVPEDPVAANKWYASLKVGDVLTFRYYYAGKHLTITHRIVRIEPNADGGYDIDLEGDNKSSDAGTLKQSINTAAEGEESLNYVIGRVTGQNKFLGFIISLVKSRVGLICFIIIPSVIIATFEIIRIIGVLGEKKRKAAQKKQDDEMDALRRELEELKRQAGIQAEATTETQENE